MKLDVESKETHTMELQVSHSIPKYRRQVKYGKIKQDIGRRNDTKVMRVQKGRNNRS